MLLVRSGECLRVCTHKYTMALITSIYEHYGEKSYKVFLTLRLCNILLFGMTQLFYSFILTRKGVYYDVENQKIVEIYPHSLKGILFLMNILIFDYGICKIGSIVFFTYYTMIAGVNSPVVWVYVSCLFCNLVIQYYLLYSFKRENRLDTECRRDYMYVHVQYYLLVYYLRGFLVWIAFASFMIGFTNKNFDETCMEHMGNVWISETLADFCVLLSIFVIPSFYPIYLMANGIFSKCTDVPVVPFIWSILMTMLGIFILCFGKKIAHRIDAFFEKFKTFERTVRERQARHAIFDFSDNESVEVGGGDGGDSRDGGGDGGVHRRNNSDDEYTVSDREIHLNNPQIDDDIES